MSCTIVRQHIISINTRIGARIIFPIGRNGRHLSYGICCVIVCTSRSQAHVCAVCLGRHGRPFGRIITLWNERVNHFLEDGPLQNFCDDLNYSDASGPVKIWYYDGDILVYSTTILSNNDTDNEETGEVQFWHQLNPPKAYHVRDRVPLNVKSRIDASEVPGHTVDNNSYRQEVLLQPFMDG